MSKLIKIFNIEIHKFHNVSVTSDQNLMINGSLDSSHWDASNRSISCYLDRWMKSYWHFLKFYCLETFANNFTFIGPNDMKILQLVASQWEESNEPLTIKFWSLVAEIMWFDFCTKILILKIFINLTFTNVTTFPSLSNLER